jgi:hypothetical protein
LARALVALQAKPGPEACEAKLAIDKGPNAKRKATAMHLHTFRDESRSWHLDLIGGRGHPWSIDLVVVIASGIMLIGLACAFAALLTR